MNLRRRLPQFPPALVVLTCALLIAPASASAARPVACFTQSPASPVATNTTVTFDSSCSTDRDNDIAGRAWDLDNDGSFDDGTGVTATRSWSAPGSYTVRLGVIDRRSEFDVETRTVTVQNRPPVSSFTFSPAEPVAGQAITFTSTSSDPDGTVATHAWDLDNDGAYDDGTGTGASWTPPAPGTYTVGLRVTDGAGGSASSAQTFVVREPPPAGEPAPGDSPPTDAPQPLDASAPAGLPELRWLKPFPTVRMRGRTTRRGAQLSLLSVRGPHGALAEVRCQGRGCPAKRLRQKLRTRSKRGSATVNFKRLQRFLPAGVQLHVSVTRKGMVGKYTRIKIRKLALPARTDRCLLPGKTKPSACPAAR